MNYKMQCTKLLLAIIVVISIMYRIDLQEGYALLIKMNIEDLVEQADYVLLGEVIDIESRWDNESRTIYTYVKVIVEKMIKGNKNLNEIVVKVPGGRVGDEAMLVSESPAFKLGERTILLLDIDTSGEYQVLGGIQGKYTVIKDRVFERDILLNDFMDELDKKLENKGSVHHK